VEKTNYSIFQQKRGGGGERRNGRQLARQNKTEGKLPEAGSLSTKSIKNRWNKKPWRHHHERSDKRKLTANRLRIPISLKGKKDAIIKAS